MKIIVLGAAAGGGFPQWNCSCRNCAGLRAGTLRSRARTQSSIAVSGDGHSWLLINASPDILSQIRATPALQPPAAAAAGPRRSGIRAVLLMDAQIDHVTGLLMLREGARLPLYCTAAVWRDINGALPLAPVLSHYCGVEWHAVHAAAAGAAADNAHNAHNTDRFDNADAAAAMENGAAAGMTLAQVPGIRLTALSLASKAPPYSPHRDDPQHGDNLGLLIENTANGKTLFYAPGLGRIEAHVAAAMRGADCVLVDGTFWHGDEMRELGYSQRSAADMGHLPQAGPGGMLELLASLGPRRKILIHINNTNPILDEDSVQRADVERQGVEVAFDGMEINL